MKKVKAKRRKKITPPVEHPKYRPKGTGIGKLVGTRINMEIYEKLVLGGVNINKEIRDYVVLLAAKL